jgi:acyl-CoA synthetase (AMP-forming)/AMP-acid ligase II
MGAHVMPVSRPPVQLEWLPWHHTMGSNVILQGILKNGGSLYIDDGRPTPEAFPRTVANLRDVAPTASFNFNVPGGYAPLCEALGKDPALKQTFFSRLERMTFAGAAISGPVRGPNVMPGYLGFPELSASAFDEEGFYRLGDTLGFIDPTAPSRGLKFSGRLSENFKMSNGTWVVVGKLRAAILNQTGAVLQDIVIGGENRDTLVALVWLNPDRARIAANDFLGLKFEELSAGGRSRCRRLQRCA